MFLVRLHGKVRMLHASTSGGKQNGVMGEFLDHFSRHTVGSRYQKREFAYCASHLVRRTADGDLILEDGVCGR